MHVQRVAVRMGPRASSSELEEQRLAKLHEVRRVRRQTHDVRHRQADEERRDRDQEAGDRAGDADVEEHPLARNRLADTDERAHGSRQEEGDRDEKRQGGVDVIIAAGKIVPELVAAEDREDRPAVDEPVQHEAGEWHRQTADADGGEVRDESQIGADADERG